MATFTQTQENLTTSTGGTAQFDTRVTFVGGGALQRKQKVNLLQVFKDGRQVYRCRNWNVYATSSCTSEGRFAVTMQGSDKFDFYLSMSNVTVTDGGSYVVKLEVIHPETGSYSSIQKTITLTVETVNGKLDVSDDNCIVTTDLLLYVHVMQLNFQKKQPFNCASVRSFWVIAQLLQYVTMLATIIIINNE